MLNNTRDLVTIWIYIRYLHIYIILSHFEIEFFNQTFLTKIINSLELYSIAERIYCLSLCFITNTELC